MRRPRNRVRLFNAESPAHRYLANLSPNSAKGMERALDAIAKIMDISALSQQRPSTWCMDDINWGELRREHVLSLKNHMQHKGLSTNTIATYLAAIKGVMKEARYLKLLSFDEYDAIRDIKRPNGARIGAGEALELTMVKQVLAACEDNSITGIRDKAIIATLVSAGLRRAELSQLSIKDIDFINNTMLVNGKGNKQRLLECYPSLMACIHEWVEGVRGTHPGALFNPIRKNGTVGDNALSTTSIYYICKKRGLLIDTDKVKPHNLRRTYGTLLVEQGVDLMTVRDLLGHESIETTKIYIRDDKQLRMKAAKQKTRIL